jgi:hypothetical protein
MSFLAPAWLLLGLAAAVPLLLHFLRRQLQRRVDFPAVRYLTRAQRENLRLRRLRNLLLLAARVSAVLALALAAAQPLGRLPGQGHAPVAVAIVLDNSASSAAIQEGRPVLENLKAAARVLLSAAAPQDRFWLITVDGTVLGGSAASLRNALEKISPYGGRGDLARAIERGLALVSGSDFRQRSLAILSDGQATQWPANLRLSGSAVSVYLAPGKPPPNRALVLAEPRPTRWTAEGALLLRISGGDSATYRVSLGSALLHGLARSGEEVMVRLAPGQQGWLGGRVELAPDELRGDDIRYFALWIGPAVAVQLRDGAGPFAAAALEALLRSGRVRSGGAVEVAPADLASRKPVVLLAPADPLRVGAANRSLERLGVPWRLGALRRQPASASGLGFPVEVRSRFVLESSGSETVDTVATVAGEPWIVTGADYLLIGSPLSLEASTLPVATPFVPWLAEQLAALAPEGRGRLLYAAPGGEVSFPSGVSGLEVEGGELLPLSVERRAPARPGVYFLRGGSSRVGALVVNPEPEESLLERLEARALQSRLESDYTSVSSDAATFARATFASGKDRPLRGFFILILLCALAIEIFMLRQGRALEAERAA